MDGKHLVLGISGGIAAYKVPELISRLRKKGLTIEVVMTPSATEFVTPLTFREISQNPVHVDMFENNIQWNVEHIALAKKADLIAIIPATANIIGKMAGGIADDLLTATVMAARSPKLIAPAMNSGMYQNPAVQRNLKALAADGVSIVGPDSGPLLCGDEGIGRLASFAEIEINIAKLLSIQDLTGEVILITAGGTREPIDPVRFIANRSSGKTGYALAEAAFKRGAKVMLVSTVAESINCHEIEIYHVETTAEMHEQVLQLAPRSSIIIKAAAPADFRPMTVSDHKIKKNNYSFELKLVLNPDILAELGERKARNQILVGFAAETDTLMENALEKLKRKNLDLIIGNLVNKPGIGMGSDQNQVTIFSSNTKIELPVMSKVNLADQLLNYILKYRTDGNLI